MEGMLNALATNKVDSDMNDGRDTMEDRLNGLATDEVESNMITDG